MIIKYNTNNISQADAMVDTYDDTMSAFVPPPKYIIIINLFIKYEKACWT